MGCGGSKIWRRKPGAKYSPSDASAQEDAPGKSPWTQAELDKLTELQLCHWLEVLRVDFTEGVRGQDAVNFLWAEIQKSQPEALKEVDGPGKLEAWPIPHLLKWLSHFSESKVQEVTQRDVLIRLLKPHVDKMPPPGIVNAVQDTFVTQVHNCVQQIKSLAGNHFCVLLKEVAEIENCLQAREQPNDQRLHLNGRVVMDFDGNLGSVLDESNGGAADHSLVQVRIGEYVEVSHRDRGGWAWCAKQDGAKGWVPANAVAEIARAVVACQPEAEDDPDETLALAEGEEVEVAMRHYSGWTLCKKITTGKEGWVPDAHLDDNPKMLPTKPYRRLLDALQQLLESTQAAEAAVFQIRVGQEKGADFKKQLYGLVLSLVEDYRNICEVVKTGLMQSEETQKAAEDFPTARVIQATKIVIETQLPADVDSYVKVIVQDPSGWAWCQNQAGKEGWIPLSSLRLRKKKATKHAVEAEEEEEEEEEEQLPDWIKLGARCAWASKNRKKRLHVRIDRICRVRRKILVTFEVSKKSWKVVGFDDLKKPDCSLKPMEATVLEASPLKEDELQAAPKRPTTAVRKKKNETLKIEEAAREEMMQELQLMALDDVDRDSDGRSSVAMSSARDSSPTADSTSLGEHDIAVLDSLSDDEDPALEASGTCDARHQAARRIQARARGVATRRAVSLPAKRAALQVLQGWFRRARARQLSAELRRAEINAREQAATRIQSSQRRHQAREEVKVLKKQRQKERAATRIQSVYRGQQARQIVSEVRLESQAASKLQRVWRGCVARHQVSVMRIEAKEARASLIIQMAYRQHQARLTLAERRSRRSAAIAIQRMARGRSARHFAGELRYAREEAIAQGRKVAATRIQASQRGRVARKDVQLMRKRLSAALLIERYVRGWMARNVVMGIRQQNSATRIQAVQRGRKARRQIRENAAALLLQTVYRGHVARVAYHAAVTEKKAEAERRATNIAASTIALAYRRHVMRTNGKMVLRRMKENRAAVRIQAHQRGKIGRSRMQDVRLCAAQEEMVVVACKGLPARVHAEAARHAAEIVALKGEAKASLMQSVRMDLAIVGLQAFARGFLVRLAALRRRQAQAAIVIQRLWLGGKVRLSQRRRQCAALRIQSVYKGSCSRRDFRIAREQQKAAIQLQAVVRGVQARSEAAVLRAEAARIRRERQELEAALRLQKVQRGRVGRTKAARLRREQEEDRAALRIQAVVRGRNCRELHKELILKARQTSAVLRIQKLYRGANARKAVGARRDESAAEAVLSEVRGIMVEEFKKDFDENIGSDDEAGGNGDRKEQLSKTKRKLLVERVQGALAKQGERLEAAVRSELAQHKVKSAKKIEEQIEDERRELFANFVAAHGMTPEEAAAEGGHIGILAALAREERRLAIKARSEKLALDRAFVARLETQRRGMLREKLCVLAKVGETVPKQEIESAFNGNPSLIGRLLVEDAVGEAAKVAQICWEQAEQPSHASLQNAIRVSILQTYLSELEERLKAECGGHSASSKGSKDRPQTARGGARASIRPGETSGQARERQLREQSETAQVLKRAEEEEKKLRHGNETRAKRVVEELLRNGRSGINKLEAAASNRVNTALREIVDAEARIHALRQEREREHNVEVQDLRNERERKHKQLHDLHNITVTMQIEKDRVEKLLGSKFKAPVKELKKALGRVKRVTKEAKRLEVDGAANKQNMSVILYTLRSLEARVAKECNCDTKDVGDDDDDNEGKKETHDAATKEYLRKKKEKWEAQDRAFREALESEIRRERERLKEKLEEDVQEQGFIEVTQIKETHGKPLARIYRRVVESEKHSEDLRARIAELPAASEMATVLSIIEGRLRSRRNQGAPQALHRAAHECLPMLRSLSSLLKVKKVTSPRFPKAKTLQEQLQQTQRKIQIMVETYPEPERKAKDEEADDAAEDEAAEDEQNATEATVSKPPASLPPPPPARPAALPPESPPKLPDVAPPQRRQSLLEAMDDLTGLEGALNALSTSVVAESNGAMTLDSLGKGALQPPSSAMRRPPSAGPGRTTASPPKSVLSPSPPTSMHQNGGFESAPAFGSSTASNFAPASGSGFAPATGLAGWGDSGSSKPARPQSAAAGSGRKGPLGPAIAGNLQPLQPPRSDLAPPRPPPTVAAWG